jgi:hypothetical protein
MNSKLQLELVSSDSVVLELIISMNMWLLCLREYTPVSKFSVIDELSGCSTMLFRERTSDVSMELATHS